MGRFEQVAEKTLELPEFLAERWPYGASLEPDDEHDRAVTQSEPIRPKELVARFNKDQQVRDPYVEQWRDLRELSKHLSRVVILDPEFGSHPWGKRPQPDELHVQLNLALFMPQLAKALPAIAGSLAKALEDAAPISNDYRVAFEALSSSIHDVGYLEDVPWQSSAIEGFVPAAQRLEKYGHADQALDLIYDSIDALLRDGQFEKCDDVLREVDEKTSIDLLLGLLTATLPAHSQLPSRSRLVRAVRDVLLGLKEDPDHILAGLEG